SARREDQPGEHLDARGLSRAVRSDETEDLALLHGEAHLFDGSDGLSGKRLPKDLGELVDVNGGGHCSKPRWALALGMPYMQHANDIILDFEIHVAACLLQQYT